MRRTTSAPFRHACHEAHRAATCTAVRGLAAVLLLVVVFSPYQALAHTENSEGYSHITRDGVEVLYQLRLDYFELGRVVDLGTAPGDPRPVLAAGLEARRPELARYLAARLTVSLDGLACPARIEDTMVEPLLDRDYAVIASRYACAGEAAGAYAVEYDVFFDDNDPLHRNLATYAAGGETQQFIFTAGERRLALGSSSLLGTMSRFVQLGFHHILSGYDHVLFVIALLLGAPRLRDLLAAASVFTVAHSLTLALAALGWVRMPPAIVEPLIALSIAYVAVEGLLGARPRYRLPAVFGFGLLHGLGFAASLTLTGAVDGSTLLSLFSFNAGVELGQGLLIGLLFPLLVLLRRFEWSRPVQVAATSLVGLLGMAWFLQRLLV